MKPKKEHLVATFSIVGFDPKNQEWGIAVQSKFLAVGAYVPFARAGSGAIATQAWCNTSFGPKGLDLLEKGMSADTVLEELLKEDEGKESRQVGVVDKQGNAATFTGKDCFNWAGGVIGKNCTCQGNILVNSETVTEMCRTFETTPGELGDRLLTALDSAQNAGGDSRGKQSAALLVVKEKGGYGGYNDRKIDLRVDDHPEPIKELIRLMELQRLYFGKTKPGNLIQLEGNLMTEVKSYLLSLGFYKGEINTVFDSEFSDAMKHYYLTENFDDRLREDDFLDLEILEFMRAPKEISPK